MVHTGYLFGKDKLSPLDKELQGATFGIGGAVRVHLWKHLRIGSEGSEILYRLYVLSLAFIANIRLQALDPIYANDSETSVLKTLGETKKDKP